MQQFHCPPTKFYIYFNVALRYQFVQLMVVQGNVSCVATITLAKCYYYQLTFFSDNVCGSWAGICECWMLPISGEKRGWPIALTREEVDYLDDCVFLEYRSCEKGLLVAFRWATLQRSHFKTGMTKWSHHNSRLKALQYTVYHNVHKLTNYVSARLTT